MPYSSVSGKAWSARIAKRLISRCNNSTILDAGAGAGNYSSLLRSALPTTRFYAIEIWEPYIAEFKLMDKYDEVIKEDIRHFKATQIYGITILGDVLEHLEKEEAIEAYRQLLSSSEFVLISIPIIYYPQDTYKGNPYERHLKDDWSHEEVLASFPHLALHFIENEIGVYIGYNPEHHTAEEVLNAAAPRMAVYGIFKNEEKFITRYLQSARHADEIVLCDTGSTDRTNQHIQAFKEKQPDIKLSTYTLVVLPWRFDDARNTALSFIDPDIDLCISMDIDEYLPEDWKEQLLEQWEFGLTRFYHKFKTYWSNENISEHWHERIHSRRGYTWKLPVHEILEYSGTERIKYLTHFTMFQRPDSDKSRASYLPLLEQSVKERRDIWKSWSFLAQEYLQAARYTEAHQAVDQALDLPNCDRSYLHKMNYFIYRAEQNHAMALLSLDSSIMHMPHRREPYFEKMKYLHHLERYTEALFANKEARKVTNAVIDYHYNAAAWGESFEAWTKTLQELARKEGVLLP